MGRQATYHVTQRWGITTGARVARDSDDYSIYQTGPFAGGTSFASGTQSETVKDPKVSINFQLDENNLVYVSAAKGDRVGGVNAPFSLTGACLTLLNEIGLNGIPPTFSSDSLWSYEVGSKNRLLDNHLVLQLSGFYIDWSNVQQSVSLPPNQCPETFNFNLGKARSSGFDLQLAAEVGPAELGLSMGYTSAKDTETLGPSTIEYVTSGQQINPYSAPWIVVPSSSIRSPPCRATRPIFEWMTNSAARTAGRLRSNSPTTWRPIRISSPNPSTNVLNAHLGLNWNGWDTSLYALNVLNSYPLLYNTALETAQFVGPTYTIRPLTVGMRAVYRW
jgi:iron complex outermembrane receptor protein